MKTKTSSLSRRDFIKTGSVAAAGLMLGGISATDVLAAAQRRREAAPATAATDRVRLACIGIGNRGWDVIRDMNRTGLCDIVALCDVDLEADFCAPALAAYPNAKRFRDFRKMFDEIAGEFDAVTVAIPDHRDARHVDGQTRLCREAHVPHFPRSAPDDGDGKAQSASGDTGG